MAVYCANDDYCVSGTGFPAYDDVYTQSGVYNLKDYFVGSTNGYYIFYDSGGFWCLATTLGGSPCFLQGKYPYNGVCPDLTFEYVNSSVCPTPTPTPTVGCDVFDFEAKLITNIDPTPSQTYTPSPTPTLTQTPTSSNFCPNIYVDAFITGITPTQTPTPTITPSVRILRYRSNQIQCNFSGDVTFMTVDSIISCPVSKQFQDCNNGFMYYTTNIVNNPSGGDLSQFMIFLGIVDGNERCITYIGNNSTYIGTNNITLSSGPIGYSNLGQCSLCTIQSTLTPTPTPTITMTPSAGITVAICSTFIIGEGGVYTYVANTNTTTSLTIPNLSNWNDIANTQTKLFISTTGKIKEWDIVLSPFSATFVRELNDTESSVTFGPGLFAINNNKLLTCNVESGLSPQTVFEISLPSAGQTSLSNSNYNELFSLPLGRSFAGDLLVTTNNKILILSRGGGNTYLSQYSYPDGDPEVEILISPTILTPTSIFVENGLIYVADTNAIVYNIEVSPPYTVTIITSPGINIYGASNSISCNNVSFEFTPTTYYKYRLCNDTNGPQTYVYQTEPSLATVSTQTIFNLTNNTCWQYDGSSTTIPQNTTDDIIIYQGNYFTEVSSTIYSNCSQCISDTECNPPSNLTSYPFSFGYDFNNGPNISWPQSETEICDIVYSLTEDLSSGIIENWGVNSQPIYLESLEVGSYAYLNQANCNCYGDGFYYIRSFILNTYTIVELSNCVIVNLWPCNPSVGTSPSNPNGTGGSSGTGGGAGGSSSNGGNTPGGGTTPSSTTCQCTAVRTISGFQGMAFYTDCDGNPAQITVPGGTGIAGAACFCRQPNSPVTGAVIIEACQSSFGQGTINNICSSTILCS